MIVVIDAISSWFVKDPGRFPRSLTGLITAPLYKPVHAVLKPEKMGGIDISPMVVILLLQGLANLLARSGL